LGRIRVRVITVPMLPTDRNVSKKFVTANFIIICKYLRSSFRESVNSHIHNYLLNLTPEILLLTLYKSRQLGIGCIQGYIYCVQGRKQPCTHYADVGQYKIGLKIVERGTSPIRCCCCGVLLRSFRSGFTKPFNRMMETRKLSTKFRFQF